MPYNIEIIAIKNELYKSIDSACESLNQVQDDFKFSTPSQSLKEKLFIQKRENYFFDDAVQWLAEYKENAKGHRPFIILVVDGFLTGSNMGNIFGSHAAEQGFAVFTVYGFDQFVHDIVRYCRYYFVRYAISFIAPEIKNHDDPNRKDCIFHKKMKKSEIKFSLDSGKICDECFSQLRPKITQEIKESIEKLLLVVSNQHPFAIIIKGGGVKGLAFAGALLELESHFSFNTFAGTSAGAIAAVLLGAGYKPTELLEIFSKKDFNDFKDATILKGILNFITTCGFFPGDEIENWINDLLKEKFPQKLNEISLKDLPTHTIVYSSRVKDGTLIFDSEKERKDSLAAFAARCSMSIPFFFSPKLVDGIRVFDGGLRNNFPLKLFTETYPGIPVIGLYLISDSKKGGTVIGELTNIAIDGEEILIVEKNLDKIVLIDTRPIKTTDFNLTPRKKEFLILSGRLGALKFIERNHKGILINANKITQIEMKIKQIKKEIFI